MSKKSKASAKQANLNRKRALKMANKAKYQSWANEGKNSKSQRSRKSNSKNKMAKSMSHRLGHCGNLACKRCYPLFLVA